ncbi:tumor necrosis factor receptor superfamily member 5 [Xiphias gladius]|uniref:tumor necrosis factor receptor superfamily member 5 n=1 Tax=Xiphias gladius TaxID=8245 RepID=UPI001A9944D1|nr:tumor necrosis factor receptor superfamily member 5 [Xiphias gladius]
MMTCQSEDMYSENGLCCDRCPAGTYMQAHCDGTKATKCGKCGHGFYTATNNHLNKCQVCSECSSHNNQRRVKDCTPTENTVCECITGYYCSNDQCDHCQRVSQCPPGKGVKVLATRTNDTICAPCEEGTYSNVKDFLSQCKTHTSCEDLGRALKTPGTEQMDTICGDLLPRCSWILPACLWSGLVLTALVLFAVVICRRAKRRSYSAASSGVPVTLVEMVPAALATSMDLPITSTELNGHCQESCTVENCKLPIFNPDDNLVIRSMNSSPITRLKASVSFAESTHNNGRAGHCTSNFLRSYSEPQEDEWCGT